MSASGQTSSGRLAGKVALLTGAGAGIGRAAARLFAREGARVVVADRDAATGEATAATIREAGGDARFIATDVTDEASVERCLAETVAAHARLDVLLNCAGGSIPEDAPITDVDLDAVYDHTLPLDLKGTMLTCRHAVPVMIRGGGGAIVNCSSIVALRGGYPMHVYSAAKGAILSFTRAIAGTYTREGIRANAICPGMVLSERIRARFGENAEHALLDDAHPFAIGDPEDIANVALFLASDESRMVTGAMIPAEGGLSAF